MKRITKEYRLVKCWKYEGDDVVFAEFINNLHLDLETAKEIVANRLDFTENKKHYTIINMSNVKSVNAQAKEYMQKEDAGLKNILAAAFVGSSLICKLISSIFIKTPKNFKSRYFSNSDEALEWVLHLKKSPSLK